MVIKVKKYIHIVIILNNGIDWSVLSLVGDVTLRYITEQDNWNQEKKSCLQADRVQIIQMN